jgi:hypothetical protein
MGCPLASVELLRLLEFSRETLHHGLLTYMDSSFALLFVSSLSSEREN